MSCHVMSCSVTLCEAMQCYLMVCAACVCVVGCGVESLNPSCLGLWDWGLRSARFLVVLPGLYQFEGLVFGVHVSFVHG